MGIPDRRDEHSHPVSPRGSEELELIAASGWRAFPPRLPEQPIFYPVLNMEYATQIARDWNVKQSGSGFVTRFAVDAAFAPRREDSLADVIDALVTTLTGHLAHEERDGLPLIGVALTAAEWRGAGFKIARRNGLSEGGKMFAWILDGAAPARGAHGDGAHADPAATLRTLRTLPPPLRLLYRAVWKPRFDKTPRW